MEGSCQSCKCGELVHTVSYCAPELRKRMTRPRIAESRVFHESFSSLIENASMESTNLHRIRSHKTSESTLS